MFIPIANARERYTICKSCIQFNSITKTCKKCGCFMPAKVIISYSLCPIGKWKQFSGDPNIRVEYDIEEGL